VGSRLEALLSLANEADFSLIVSRSEDTKAESRMLSMSIQDDGTYQIRESDHEPFSISNRLDDRLGPDLEPASAILVRWEPSHVSEFGFQSATLVSYYNFM
jgi:hypothetical protein